MKKGSTKNLNDDLREESDLAALRGGVRGKYYARAMSASNLVLIEPDLATLFPDAAAVNRALTLLADTATSAMRRLTRFCS